VTLVIDAAPIVALAESDEPRRQATLDVMRAEPGGLIIPSPVTAEIDYLLGQRFGRTARGAFLRDLAAGRFIVACPDHEDYTKIADRYETDRMVSFDERHFRAVTPLAGGSFTILPADN